VTNIPLARKPFWTPPMELLRDQALLDANFGPFGDSANLDARYVHCLPRMYHRVRNHFGRTQWSGDVSHVESCFGLFGDSVSVSAR
jgi:hypothetical protein